MPWVYFSRNYEFKPRPNWMVLYRAGGTYLVTRACAERAIATEAAIPAQRPEMDRDAARKTNGRRPLEA